MCHFQNWSWRLHQNILSFPLRSFFKHFLVPSPENLTVVMGYWWKFFLTVYHFIFDCVLVCSSANKCATLTNNSRPLLFWPQLTSFLYSQSYTWRLWPLNSLFFPPVHYYEFVRSDAPNSQLVFRIKSDCQSKSWKIFIFALFFL